MVPIDDKDDLKVIAEARLMLENDNVPVVPCVIGPNRGGREEDTVRAKLLTESRDTWTPDTDEGGNTASHGDHISGKRTYRNFSLWPGSQADTDVGSYEDTRS